MNASSTTESRKHERFELYASVELHAAEMTMILPAQNISRGGVFLAADGHDLSGFRVGTLFELLVFDALNEQRGAVTLMGKVVRQDRDGMAVEWAHARGSDAELARLLETMTPKTKK